MDATRRTHLASERTLLAWVRTGLTSTAVALGIGRVVPDVADTAARWPYTVVGAGYALLGAALVGYGFRRGRATDAAIDAGGFAEPGVGAMRFFAATGILLALATAALVLAG